MKNFFKVLLAMLLVLTVCLSVVACGNNNQTGTPDSGDETPGTGGGTPDNGDETTHEHSYVNGKCECGESDPAYELVNFDIYVTADTGAAADVYVNDVEYFPDDYGHDEWRLVQVQTYVGAELNIRVETDLGYTFDSFEVLGEGEYTTYENTITKVVEEEDPGIVCHIVPPVANTVYSAHLTNQGGWKFEGGIENGYMTTIEKGHAPTDLEDVIFQVIYNGVDGEKLRTVNSGHLTLDKGNYDPNVAGTYEVTFTLKEDTSYVFRVTIIVDGTERFNIQCQPEDSSYAATSIYVGSELYTGSVARFPAGTVVTLKPRSTSAYSFAGWYYLNEDGSIGDFVSADKEYTFTVSTDASFVACFLPADPTVTVNVVGGGEVTINGEAATEYVADVLETVTLVATAENHYTFAGWFVNGQLITTEATWAFNINRNINIEARFLGKSIIMGMEFINYSNDNPKDTVLVTRTTDTGERETIEVDHLFAFSLRYGDTVEFIAKPSDGYYSTGFGFDDGEPIVTTEGYYKWTVDRVEDTWMYAYFLAEGNNEEDINLYVDFDGSMCDDCYVYLNGIKMTKANHKSITVKDQSKVSFVAIECGECEGFRYYIHTNGPQAGTVITDGVYSFIVSTDACKQVTTNFGTEYTLYFDACFGFETVTVGMFHDEDVVDVIVENAYSSAAGEHVTLENTLDLLFGAVYGETIRLNVEIPEDWTAYTFTIEITVTYSNLDAKSKVIKTYYIHSDDLDGDYYDLVIEYPGYYEIDVSAGKVVN